MPGYVAWAISIALGVVLFVLVGYPDSWDLALLVCCACALVAVSIIIVADTGKDAEH
jgi:hypothetical protein